MSCEGITLVASRRPPSPASMTAYCTRAAAKATNAAAVSSSNWVTGPSSPAERSATSAACSVRSSAWVNASSEIGSPRIRTRSRQDVM